MKTIKSKLLFIFAIMFATTFTSCAAVTYMKKNCRIETEIGANSFICVICDFSNASDELKSRIQTKLAKP